MPFTIVSDAFKPGERIPRDHTCDGKDLSPALRWENPPPGTKAFALICDDPDAPGATWVHWVMWNIPASSKGLAQGVQTTRTLTDGSVQGKNDFGRIGYGGPCPPKGKPHRYFFKLYALDAAPGLAAGATRAEVLAAMKGHVLAEGELMGLYGR